MKRVLITGIKGFTGRYVAAELEQCGWEVWGMGTTGVDSERYRCADLLNPMALRAVVNDSRPDAVVHLAAIAFVGHGQADEFYKVNVIGTRHLLWALAECKVVPGCVLLASSANVYGNTTSCVLNEETKPVPANDYAVSKLAMEYMAKLWTDRLPIVIARPFNYTGIGQAETFLLPKIAGHFRRRSDVIELGNLDISRDFSDVRAVASAYRRLLEVAPVGETVNVCSGKVHSLKDVLAMAEHITGHSIEVRVNPEFVRANEIMTLRGDVSKLNQLLGEWATPPLEETLSWMLKH